MTCGFHMPTILFAGQADVALKRKGCRCLKIKLRLQMAIGMDTAELSQVRRL